MSEPAVNHLVNEGVTNINDLCEFTADTFNVVLANSRRITPAVTFSAISATRLTTTADLLRFYNEVGRDVTVSNITWSTVISNFQTQWKGIVNMKKHDDLPTPTLVGTNVIKWIELFSATLNQCVGA